jgi:hypothetical protein
VAHFGRNGVVAGARLAGEALPTSAEDGNRSIQPYASFLGLVRDFLQVGLARMCRAGAPLQGVGPIVIGAGASAGACSAGRAPGMSVEAATFRPADAGLGGDVVVPREAHGEWQDQLGGDFLDWLPTRC